MAFHTLVNEIAGEAYQSASFPLLELDRGTLDEFPLRGFALQWNTKLMLLQTVSEENFRLNGYSVIRNADVVAWRPVLAEEFMARAAKLQRLRPAAPAGIDISTVQSAVTSAGAAYPLLTLHREALEPDVCYVGKVVSVNARKVQLLEISPDAAWDEEKGYALKELTRIDFDGAYEQLLAKLAPR